MSKYDFLLTPAYCLFNGIGIVEQKEHYIKFMIQNIKDEILKERLKRSFVNHINVIESLERKSHSKECVVEFEKVNREQIRRYVSSLYALENRGEDNGKEDKVIDRKNQSDEAAAVLLLDRILTEGRAKHATDIHIEDKSIRFRINGVLEKQMSVSGKRYSELIQRIKLLSGMNVLEKKANQDGHFIYGGKNPLFVRTSSVNLINDCYEGKESVVLRLLDTSRIPLSIDSLGFNENQLERIREFNDLKNGLILVCGPTGSGKSTTVASILVEMEKSSNGRTKIISLEDPPEYVIPGISQIKIEKNNMDEVLNHIFRLDPDVIMIGEIRDEITAMAALKASLTGHLVFATIHTGCVSESILRLENLGLSRNHICNVLKGVICQELSYVGKEIKLYADIGIPKEHFQRKVSEDMSEEEIDEFFIHETNYGEVLAKTLEIMTKKDFQLNKKEGLKQNRRLKMWRSKNGKVYKRIV